MARPDHLDPPLSRRRGKPRVPSALTDASSEPDVIELPARTAISIEGRGAPHGSTFDDAVGALSAVATAALHIVDVLPLEARFFAEPPYVSLSEAPVEEWRFRIRIAVPDDTDEEAVRADNIALERIPPMRVGRVLYTGPVGKELLARIAALHETLGGMGLVPSGAHSEVYLSDPRETAPGELETVILVELS
jgi:hypothetical protein